jgi:hypothetical protein
MIRKRIVSDRAKIVRSIERIIHYWLEGRYGQIAPYLDNDVIMYLPHLKYRIAGKREALNALRKSRQFCDIRRYCERDFKVETRDDVSIAHCTYSLEYKRDIERMTESGLYSFVFKSRKEKWRIVRWSMMTTETGVCRTAYE